MVEAAFVLPVLFLLIFGVMELGGAMKSRSTAANAVRAGGRMASVAGNNAMADQMILQRVAREAAALDADEIQYIVIWHADGPGDPVPAGCIPGTFTAPNQTSVGVSDGDIDAIDACNVYIRPEAPGGAFAMANDEAAQSAPYYFGCTGSSDPEGWRKVDCHWSPTHRKIVTSPRGVVPIQTPDYVGVHIRATHRYYTGFLGKQMTLADSAINLIEPQGFAVTEG